MKLDVSTPLVGVTGKPLMVDEKTQATLKWALVESLMGGLQGETLTGTEKVQNGRLAQKIQGADGELELSVEQAAKAKERACKFFGTAVALAVADLFDPPAVNPRKYENGAETVAN